jgi:hypothetical protein
MRQQRNSILSWYPYDAAEWDAPKWLQGWRVRAEKRTAVRAFAWCAAPANSLQQRPLPRGGAYIDFDVCATPCHLENPKWDGTLGRSGGSSEVPNKRMAEADDTGYAVVPGILPKPMEPILHLIARAKG